MATKKESSADQDKKDVAVVEPSSLFALDADEKEVLKLAMLSPVNANVRYDRKINMGNFESLGVGVSVTMPVGLTDEQYAAMERMTRRAIEEANKIAASETNAKVARVKARLRGEENA